MSRLLGPTLAATAFHAAVLAAYVAAFHGDPSSLACVARERLGQSPYEFIDTGFDKNGYDGQFYYALARAPWRPHHLDIDAPAVRQARILYPAISWLLSAGDGRRLLWVMPCVNLLAIAALAGLGAKTARDYGLSPWWGALLPFAVNAGMPVLRNLTDVLSTLSVAALLIAWLRGWPWWTAGLCAAAALFGREQNVVVVMLVVVFTLWRARTVPGSPQCDKRWLAGIVAALLSWSLWLGVLRLFYGEWSLLPAGGNLGAPLSGMLYRWTHLAGESTGLTIFHIVCMFALTLQLGLAIRLMGTPSDGLLRSVAAAGFLLALMGGLSLYGDSWSYPRVFAWLPLSVWLACVQLRWRWPLLALSAPVMLPLAVLVRAWSGTV
jgi:hypothetical protein